jgi:Leucine-rich repeat (LRR) protein
MDRLQKLQLDNNIICRIQGLDHLVNLEWLDLSFNLIEKVEGLEKLTKLIDLSLFSNNISQISGLETLTKLNVLSLGSNKITDYGEAIKYLYNLRFPNLQVLKMADNPFYKLKEAEYRYYAIAFLRKLKYLDYELIDEETRSNAQEKHREEFNEQETAKNTDGVITDEQERQADPALKDAKIDVTVGMIARILREDADSKMLSALPKF